MAKILATFRIDENDWNAFKEWAESRGNNASSELVAFIESSIGRAGDRRESIDPDSLDKRIEGCLDKHLNKLDSGIDKKIDTAIESLRANPNTGIIDRLSALEDAIGIITERFERTERSIADTRSEFAPALELAGK